MSTSGDEDVPMEVVGSGSRQQVNAEAAPTTVEIQTVEDDDPPVTEMRMPEWSSDEEDDGSDPVRRAKREEKVKLLGMLRSMHLHPWEGISQGLAPHLSKIARGPFHLQKLAKMKDTIVVSGPNASINDSTVNLTNTIIGAGILTMPIIYKMCGIGLQTFLLALCGLALGYSAYLLIICGNLANTASYEDTAKKAFGPWSAKGVAVLVAIQGFLILVAYLILLGDFGTELFELTFNRPANREVTIITLGLVFCLPLSLLSNINSLRFTSVLAMILVFFYVCVMVGKWIYATSKGETPGDIEYFKIDTRIFESFPLAINSYACHVNVYPIYAEMKHRNVKNGVKAISRGFGFSGLMFAISGIAGYLLFGEATDGNILNNFKGEGGILIAVYLAFTFVVISSYPLMNFGARLALTNLVWRDHKTQTYRGWIVSSITFALALGIALFIESVAFVLGVCGSFGTSLLTMIIPGAMYIRLHKSRRRWFKHPNLMLSWALVVSGVIIMISGLVTTIKTEVDSL